MFKTETTISCTDAIDIMYLFEMVSGARNGAPITPYDEIVDPADLDSTMRIEGRCADLYTRLTKDFAVQVDAA